MITPTLDDIGRMVRGAGQPDPAEPELVGTLIEIIVDGKVRVDWGVSPIKRDFVVGVWTERVHDLEWFEAPEL